ncbi:MAG: DEAD/DEAH box helicase family protein, partial [Deltaproteobacteria bacterium]|nr:DEAD/DEAH box helicase family protein [Deltaproteobacteria bacterium]
MADTQGNATIYRKLIRDRIPEIIREHGGKPIVRKIDGQEFNEAVAIKILEEAFELFTELRQANRGSILEESADMLETMLAALKAYGFDLSDLHAKMAERAADRGGFKGRLFLEQVGGAKLCELDLQKYPALIFNPSQKNRLISLIKGELERSAEAWIASAFYSPGETNLLVSEFSRFVENGGKLKIILSTMGNITRPEYLNHMKEHIPGAGLKVFHPPKIPFDQAPPNFHVKAWLFRHRDGRGAMITGSSNFTEGGLVRNYEWNWYSSGEINLPFENRTTPFQWAVAEFEQMWEEESAPVTEEFLTGYRARWQPQFIRSTPEVAEPESPKWGKQDERAEPNSAQKEALENLENLREQNVTKAAVVAATGVGKTYLAAFDFVQSKSKNLLFIAHRETILTQALETFRIVTGDPEFGAVYGRGQTAPQDCAAVFAMIQTLSRRNHLKNFLTRDFDYIVIDEFHHAEAASYRKILSHFEPSFLLGLTATPERMDGRDVLEYCDYNIAYEIRILEAVNRGWLVPFQYYAIYDETDYEEITWRGTRYDEEELNRVLQNDTRTSIIANNLRKHLPASGKTKALAFCSSVSHARYTAEKLSHEHGILSTALWGETADEERHNAIRRLQDEFDPLNVICVVDIFNEGTDIPGLTHVLFLRPTQSFTIFLQQLGRGLRKSEGKDFLVVLDFVGNFRKAHVAPLAVCGYTSLEQFVAGPQISLRKVLEQKLPDGCWLSPDLEVRRLWESEIKKIFQAGLSPAERLKNIYQDIKEDLGKKESLNLMDMISNAYDVDPYLFLKPEPFGGWLRAKNYCESGKIPDAEKSLLDTPGEYLLTHVETGLNFVKSYKMVVFLSLLKLNGTKWDIEDIARKFLAYYLSHTD